MKASITDFSDEFYRGKKILVRVDFNVPLKNGKVDDDYRIRSSIPTLNYLSSKGGRLILASHLGRPDGKREPDMSLKPVAKHLQELLPDKKVKWANECIGKDTEKSIKELKNGELLMLENLRFHSEEEANDEKFSHSLASLADIYVNDAFSASHRKHASTYGAPSLLQFRLASLQVQKELKYLTKVRDAPDRPFTVVIGGSKIHDKISALKRLIVRADKILIGGGLAYTFLASKGILVGKSNIENDFIEWAGEILSKKSGIFLPEDHLVAPGPNALSQTKLVRGDIPSDMKGFDIGPLTLQTYMSTLASVGGTIFWNGPMGMFEIREFSQGTMGVALATALAHFRGATTIVGGGDSISALRKAGIKESEVSHISTGGGASLEFLGEKSLPGIEILNDK